MNKSQILSGGGENLTGGSGVGGGGKWGRGGKLGERGREVGIGYPPVHPLTKQETLPKGVGVAKFDLTKPFRNQLFSRVRVLCHQYSIKNHNESILKSKTTSIFMIFFLSDFLRIILKRNCSPYSTLMTMYLSGAILCSNVL